MALTGACLLALAAYHVSNPDVIRAMQGFESGRLEIALPCAIVGALLLAIAAVVAFRARRAGETLPPASVGMGLAGACLLALAAYQREALTLSKPVIYTAAYAAI